MLQDMGMDRVSHIDTGFGGWTKAGLPTQKYEDWKAAKG